MMALLAGFQDDFDLPKIEKLTPNVWKGMELETLNHGNDGSGFRQYGHPSINLQTMHLSITFLMTWRSFLT